MHHLTFWLSLILNIANGAMAQRYQLNQSHWRQCVEAFGPASFSPGTLASGAYPQSAITLNFANLVTAEKDPIVSVAIFRKSDGQLGGKVINGKMHYVCDSIAIEAGACRPESYGAFIGRLEDANHPILTEAVHISQYPSTIYFPLTGSGSYCVEAIGFTASTFSAVMRLHSAHGYLPAIQVGKWHFMAFCFLSSLCLSVAVAINHFKGRPSMEVHRSRLFVLVICLVCLDAAIAWANLTYINRHGYPYACETIRTLNIILRACRNAAVVFFALQSLRSRPSQDKSSPWVAYVLGAAAFAFTVGREREMLRDRNESRDALQLLWTLGSGVVIVISHIECLRKTMSLRRQPFREGKVTGSRAAHCTSLAMAIFTFCFLVLDAVLLRSWSRADEYGHDLLTRLWWARWFLVDEWQTISYLGLVVVPALGA
ncbi:uncharacterized protein BO72DRAFT_493590 [Aspergillus fijiensis CBS 313.89]|uniref:PTM1-like N-terminal domain-containing protein n=1 Tax=Aspergillus fijiensis CBS 313.89 TaxID=1448319 RepID=A0A8G1RWW8_9EURO|nr:uncharacterized protein BO72DRAFT_493590 [Aspergillus fijiensis CBS 313.89]RAK80247.1 hypothetical protein BO72DRAFT_493590 [Aspergillus fijiensis CBS 313.89]